MKNRKFILANLILAAASFANRDHAAASKALKAAAEDPDFEDVAEEVLEEQARLALAGDEDIDVDVEEDADVDEDEDFGGDPEEVLSKFVAGRDAAKAAAKAKAKKATASDDEDDEEEDEGDEALRELTASLRGTNAATAKPKLSERAKANLAAVRRTK